MYLIVISGFIAFLLSLILTPIVRDIFSRLGIVDQPDAIRKFHARPVPRVGGIAIAIAYVGTFGMVFLFSPRHAGSLDGSTPALVKLFCAAGIMFATGLLDDLIRYQPWQKLIGQVWAAAVAYLGGVQTHVAVAGHPWHALWNAPLSVLWLVACANAFNLIDGLDGLAAGVGLLATLTTFVAALIDHNLQLALVTLPLAGCLAGFLRYNFNPASVFLGDCGSLLIGFLLGCYGLIWGQHSVTLLGLTPMMLAVSIPVLDVTVAIVRRFLRDRPIFGADRAHIHHMLLAKGFTVRGTALLMYGVSGLAAAFSICAHALHNRVSGLVIVLFCVTAWIGVQRLGYTEFATARRLFLKGTFRKIIDTEAKLQEFERALVKAPSLEEIWKVLVDSCGTFNFDTMRLSFRGFAGEWARDSTPEERLWEIRIPLGGRDYINFRRTTACESLPYIGNFVKLLVNRFAVIPLENESAFSLALVETFQRTGQLR